MDILYEKLLDRAREKLPESAKNIERFEVQKVRGHLEGNKTVITNFAQIAEAFRREKEHLLKYLLKELATPGRIERNNNILFGTKVASSRINEKIKQYATEFVICKECGKPDTKFEKESESLFLKCLACGARNPIKARI